MIELDFTGLGLITLRCYEFQPTNVATSSFEWLLWSMFHQLWLLLCLLLLLLLLISMFHQLSYCYSPVRPILRNFRTNHHVHQHKQLLHRGSPCNVDTDEHHEPSPTACCHMFNGATPALDDSVPHWLVMIYPGENEWFLPCTKLLWPASPPYPLLVTVTTSARFKGGEKAPGDTGFDPLNLKGLELSVKLTTGAEIFLLKFLRWTCWECK